MNRQAVNPYLPSWEYIPDGEPHVFNGRVYVYGSHDRFNAPIFCVNDYVCWSAPVEDLSEWRYEGVIYRKKQDPKNPLGYHLLFAPDVCQGPDGRYYLYYAFDFLGIMSVAVCDTPLVITMSYATLPAKALTEISLTAALWLVRVISSWTATCPKSTQLTIWAIHMAGCSS